MIYFLFEFRMNRRFYKCYSQSSKLHLMEEYGGGRSKISFSHKFFMLSTGLWVRKCGLFHFSIDFNRSRAHAVVPCRKLEKRGLRLNRWFRELSWGVWWTRCSPSIFVHLYSIRDNHCSCYVDSVKRITHFKWNPLLTICDWYVYTDKRP